MFCDLGLSYPSIVGVDMNYNVVETSVGVWCIYYNSVCGLTSVFTPEKDLGDLRKWCCQQGCLDGASANDSISSTRPPGGQ